MTGRFVCTALLSLFLFILALSDSVSALTWEQVIALKRHGVDDRTIQLMIKQEEAARRDGEAGVKEIRDAEGKVIIVYSTGSLYEALDDEERERVNKAWEMLKRIIIDGRK